MQYNYSNRKSRCSFQSNREPIAIKNRVLYAFNSAFSFPKTKLLAIEYDIQFKDINKSVVI